MKIAKKIMLALAVAAGLLSTSAHASLTGFKTYTGTVGVSTDGWGSQSQAGIISASVPAGSTVLAAYLYTSTFENGALTGVGGTLAGTTVAYSTLGLNAPACCSLTAARSDVTSIIKPLIDGGAGGIYNFAITETSASQDGSALVVVYNNAALGTSTIGILDGFASVTGDTTSINFASPLNPLAAGFKAEMMLGIGFSCCTSQQSTVKVNGDLLTEFAGNNDDGEGPGFNGRLITVGGFDDPLSAALPNYETDHERYNLAPFITAGDTSISIETFNTSRDDNIFLAVFDVTGIAGINEEPPSGDVPEPVSLALVGLGLAGLGVQRRRSKRVK